LIRTKPPTGDAASAFSGGAVAIGSVLDRAVPDICGLAEMGGFLRCTKAVGKIGLPPDEEVKGE
jgi:hypothetical protein